jgi:hypothetical protein
MTDPFDRRRARFTPKRTDDLSRIAPPIGWEGDWMAAWVHEEGPYAGQMVWTAPWSERPFGWVPEEDLEFLSPPVSGSALKEGSPQQ